MQVSLWLHEWGEKERKKARKRKKESSFCQLSKGPNHLTEGFQRANWFFSLGAFWSVENVVLRVNLRGNFRWRVSWWERHYGYSNSVTQRSCTIYCFDSCITNIKSSRIWSSGKKPFEAEDSRYSFPHKCSKTKFAQTWWYWHCLEQKVEIIE